MHTKLEFIDDYSDNFTQVGKHDEEELNLIGQQNDTNLSIDLDALSCLRYFPNVINLILRPGCINEEHLHYLYSTSIKRLKLDYYSDSLDEYAIDLSKFARLECVFSRTEFNYRNVNKCISLTSLIVQEWQICDLKHLNNAKISRLKLLSGRLTSLKGISQLSGLKHLSISNQRSLKCISDVKNCVDLEYLEIESCNKLILSSVPTLNYLRSLVLIGRQSIENCDFFLRFPKLERLILGIKIADGNISYLLNLKHCAILTDYRHYTHKNSELPKLSKTNL